MEDLASTLATLIDTLIGITVILLLFATGLAMTFKEATVLWRKPKKLVMSLLAAVVLTPIVAYGVLYVSGQFIDIPVEVVVGIMLLSAASGSAMAPKLAEKVGADIADATSLMITLALTTILSAPIVVALIMPPDFALSGADVAASVFKSVLLPLLVGLVIRTWWMGLADVITEPLTKLSNNMLSVIIIVIIVKDLDVILGFGLGALVVMLAVSVLYVLIGHLLGGPSLSERITLGISTSQRNGAIAMIVASQAMPAAIPAIVGAGVVILVVIVLYMGVFNKKKETAGEPAAQSGLQAS